MVKIKMHYCYRKNSHSCKFCKLNDTCDMKFAVFMYRIEYKQYIKEYATKYNRENRERLNALNKLNHEIIKNTDEFKEKKATYMRHYRKDNIEKFKAIDKKRYEKKKIEMLKNLK